MSRFLATFALVALLGGFPERVNAQNVDPTRAKSLTVEQATELLKKPNSLRVEITDLFPEAAAVLAPPWAR